MNFLADPGCWLNAAPKPSGSYAGPELPCDRTAENQISIAEHQSQVMTSDNDGDVAVLFHIVATVYLGVERENPVDQVEDGGRNEQANEQSYCQCS